MEPLEYSTVLYCTVDQRMDRWNESHLLYSTVVVRKSVVVQYEASTASQGKPA